MAMAESADLLEILSLWWKQSPTTITFTPQNSPVTFRHYLYTVDSVDRIIYTVDSVDRIIYTVDSVDRISSEQIGWMS